MRSHHRHPGDVISWSFRLPFPPTVNHYWRIAIIHGRPRSLLSADGRRYKKDALQAIGLQRRPLTSFTGRIRVRIKVYPPDRRKRDLDNLFKATLDVMTAAKIWNDDEQIDDLGIVRGEVRPGGEMDIIITRIEELKE